MLYKKNKEELLDEELFRNPTKEYRGAPFWSWNCKLDEGLLKRQIEYFKEMGFGGYIMHPRYGLDTEYLSDEFMDFISFCINEGKRNDMLSWLYDEDRWPSGFAGGIVTKVPKYRQRGLYITKDKSKLPVFETNRTKALDEGLAYFLACFDVQFDDNGNMISYNVIEEKSAAEYEKYYAYSMANPLTDGYNNFTYADIMQPDAMKRFIEVTHNEYYKRFGKEYDINIPAIFTDEPRHRLIEKLYSSDAESVAAYYWTYDFEDSFKVVYGYSMIEKLPEFIWEDDSYVRYDYFNHALNLLKNAFFKQISDATAEQSLLFTGHLMCEHELWSQIQWTGDAMRLYPYFDIPGIDLLYDNIEFLTSKQAQSIVHQYNKEGMLCELYGVTGWDFDFKCLKMQGDYLAALGVTIRVPHLSMLSMEGRSKRDYPASFNYQSPWYEEFKYLEDHFARVATILTRGEPVVKVAMLHPIETSMMSIGTHEKTDSILEEQDAMLQNIMSSVIYANIDFDFLCEALLSEQVVNVSDVLSVGAMEYNAVVIPPIKTIRSTTLDILEKFISNGGKVIFMGDCPMYCNGRKSDKAISVYNKSIKVGFDMAKLIKSLEDERDITISGTEKLVYQLRKDNSCYWLFIARAEKLNKDSAQRKEAAPKKIIVTVNDEFDAKVYDTLNGKVYVPEYSTVNGKTKIYYDLYANDSLMLCLTKANERNHVEVKETFNVESTLKWEKATYKRTEPNVVLFDVGQYSLDKKKYSKKEYLLELNRIISQKAGIEYSAVQPYAKADRDKEIKVYLQFEFESEIEIDDVTLAIENARECSAFLNGRAGVLVDGYYVDEKINLISLNGVKKGKNRINVEIPFSSVKMIEPCYLLGEFDVFLCDGDVKIKNPGKEIEFGAVTKQGMPFYGGNIIYTVEGETGSGSAKIKVEDFGAHCIRVMIDDENADLIALAPFCIEKELCAGKHKFEFICYGNRNNTFGPVHNCKNICGDYYISPRAWEKSCEYWNDKYFLQNTGILSSPLVEMRSAEEKH